MNWAILRSMVCSSSVSSEFCGQLVRSRSLATFCCNTCNSDVFRCTPESTLKRKRDSRLLFSSITKAVSISPPEASTLATSMPLLTKKARTCGQSCPGATLTTAQLLSPRRCKRTASNWEPAVKGAGRGAFPVTGIARFTATSGIG